MALKQLSLFAFICAFILLGGRSVLANPQDDEFDDDEAFDDDDDFEGEKKEDPVESEPVDYEPIDAPLEAPDAPGESIFGQGLLLTRDTMQFGGMIGIQIDVVRSTETNPDNPMETRDRTDGGGVFTFAPEAGYFIIDYLELLAGIGFNIPFGDAHPYAVKSVYFDVGARYIFDFHPLYLYAGLKFGMNFNIVDIESEGLDGETVSDSDTLTSVLLSIPVGLLIPLNRHVAIDVGTRFIFDIGVGDNDVFQMHIPIAYFGVEGFFNFFH